MPAMLSITSVVQQNAWHATSWIWREKRPYQQAGAVNRGQFHCLETSERVDHGDPGIVLIAGIVAVALIVFGNAIITGFAISGRPSTIWQRKRVSSMPPAVDTRPPE
jgi:hypothetical protein